MNYVQFLDGVLYVVTGCLFLWYVYLRYRLSSGGENLYSEIDSENSDLVRKYVAILSLVFLVLSMIAFFM